MRRPQPSEPHALPDVSFPLPGLYTESAGADHRKAHIGQQRQCDEADSSQVALFPAGSDSFPSRARHCRDTLLGGYSRVRSHPAPAWLEVKGSRAESWRAFNLVQLKDTREMDKSLVLLLSYPTGVVPESQGHSGPLSKIKFPHRWLLC